jgi:hypothetical protein
MAAGDATAADVPGKYDIVLAGKGYVFADTVEPSLPFRTHRAIYDITPTFVQRSNVSNSYGDNAQDFFLTARQRDWSLGEQEKFFHSGQDGRYWMGRNVDIATPGQVTLTPQFPVSSALAEAVVSGCRSYQAVQACYVAGATKLFQVNGVGGSALINTHGLGAAPAIFGMCTDGANTFLSTTAAGTVGVRKMDTAGTFSTFSATGADSLAFVNNTLYGLQGFNSATPRLIQYDSAGTTTTLFTWQLADGATNQYAPLVSKIEPFGGKLLILLSYGQDAGGELWIYDGSGASRLAVFPSNFYAYDIEVLYGVAYVAGVFLKSAAAFTSYMRPAIHFFDGSNVGLLWQANGYGTTTLGLLAANLGPYPSLGLYEGNLVFTDDTTGNLMSYSPARGGVSTIATYTVSGTPVRLVSTGSTIVHLRGVTTYQSYPATTYPSSGYIISSLIDFDSSLTKQFRGVKVDWAAASDGDGGSIDIAYQVDSLDGSWTTLQTGAVSGTEYAFSNVSGHSIALKITINKGTSTAGPTLKNLNVRAAPVLRQFRSGLYVVDCTGSPDAPRELRDGTYHPLAPFDQVKNLLALAQTTTPFSVTDRLGTFTALVDLNDPEGFDIYEEHPSVDNPEKSGSFLARVKVREV